MGYNKYMKEALREAEIAGSLGEVPIGAVIVRDGEIIARGHNLTETTHDPTAHAEMIAIRQAAQKLGGWRLPGCEMYVTCEPCTMCAGALVWSRMEKLHIATMDPKAGACGSGQSASWNVGMLKWMNMPKRRSTKSCCRSCSPLACAAAPWMSEVPTTAR